jgi:hypothetical protein
MTRKTSAITTGTLLVIAYVLLVLNILPTPMISDSIRDQIIPCVRPSLPIHTPRMDNVDSRKVPE